MGVEYAISSDGFLTYLCYRHFQHTDISNVGDTCPAAFYSDVIIPPL